MMTFGLSKPTFVFWLRGPSYLLTYDGTNCLYLAEDARVSEAVPLEGPFVTVDVREMLAEDLRTLTPITRENVYYVTESRVFYVIDDRVHLETDLRMFAAEDDTSSTAEDDRLNEVIRNCNA